MVCSRIVEHRVVDWAARSSLVREEFEVGIMIEVVTEEMHGPDRDSDLNCLRASLSWYGTYFYESEMALISEWMEQCGKKILDNAGIVRDAAL